MYLEQFILERNIVEETAKRYRFSVNKYEEFHQMPFDDLVQEAIDEEENTEITKRQRKIKNRLLHFRTYLVNETDLKISTVNGHIRQLRTIYKQFDVEVPDLPRLKDTNLIETTYIDLPTREHIRMALDLAGIQVGSLILFMASSGTARTECANLTVGDFINGCAGYYTKETLPEIIEELYGSLEDIVPTIYVIRQKKTKNYYTFCTPEASHAILEWLMLRLKVYEDKEDDLTMEDPLWNLSERQITYHFTNINDELNFGFKGQYRFFRPHTLRKFHGSNIGLEDTTIDLLHGRSKDSLHATYIKTNPERLKKIYMAAMENVTINGKTGRKDIIHEDFTININVMLMGSDSSITI